MGNRGILHDDQQNIIRSFKLKTWLTCVLEFRGRKRQVMAPHRYLNFSFWMKPQLLQQGTALALNAAEKILTGLNLFGLKATQNMVLMKRYLSMKLIKSYTKKELIVMEQK